MNIFTGVADPAPLGAVMKMVRYRTPVILALKRGANLNGLTFATPTPPQPEHDPADDD